MISSSEILGIIVAFAPVLVWYRRSYKRLPYPPGPPRHMLIGNLRQVPKSHPWLTWTEWTKVFGPVICLRVFSRTIIILSSAQTVSDLLDNRSEIYSGRPSSVFYCEMIGRELELFSISDTHPRFKPYRKLLTATLNSRTVVKYRELPQKEALVLMRRIAVSPDEWLRHVRRDAAAIALLLAYGYPLQEEGEDPMMDVIEEAGNIASQAGQTGRWMVDVIPALRYVPDWVPGAEWKKVAKEWRHKMVQFSLVPFQRCKDEIAKGTYNPCFVSSCLLPEDGHEMDEEEENTVRWAADALFAGAADTTVAPIGTFVLAMLLNPSIQAHAQAEIDAAIGGCGERLPTLADKDDMPYVQAVIKELYRWKPPAPIGLPHMALEDDIYKKYSIPKGSVVFANIWAIMRDETMYPDPETFNPDRFLGDNAQPDSKKFAFGFGRRSCPGMHFAEASVFLNITYMLASFVIKPTSEGEYLKYAYTANLVSRPEPFKCQFVPRPGAAKWLSD